jgi:hypothetical protein
MPFTTVLDDVPAKLMAGDSVSWKRSFPDYPAPAWVLTYALVNKDFSYIITGTDDGSDHLVEISAETSLLWESGVYFWKAILTNSSLEERYTVEEGRIEILADYATAPDKTSVDPRSHAQKVIDILEPVIEGKVSKDVANYAIAGRSLSTMSMTEIRETYIFYKQIRASEIKREKIRQGKRTGNRIKVRFT